MLKTTHLAKREVVNQLLTHSRLTNVEISKQVGVSLATVYNIRKKIQAVHLSVIKQVLVDLVHSAIQLDRV